MKKEFAVKKYFSMETLGRVSSKIKALLPIKVHVKRAKESFELFAVQGVGFLEDFIVYSRIPAKYWHNASPGTRKVTTVTNSMFNAMLYDVAAGSAANTTIAISNAGAQITYTSAATNAATVALTLGDDEEIVHDEVAMLPEATEAIEASVLPERTLITPKQVFHELERVPTMFSLLDIEKKIAMYKAIATLIRTDRFHGVKATIGDLDIRLNARLKYRNDKKVRAFFDQFQNTTDALIENLLSKYEHLRIGPADDFIPEMPDDALEQMCNYATWTHKVTGSKPVFYLIAGEADFKRKVDCSNKRDPILLVQSPFGFYWQILGAWDEEMRHVQEL